MVARIGTRRSLELTYAYARRQCRFSRPRLAGSAPRSRHACRSAGGALARAPRAASAVALRTRQEPDSPILHKTSHRGRTRRRCACSRAARRDHADGNVRAGFGQSWSSRTQPTIVLFKLQGRRHLSTTARLSMPRRLAVDRLAPTAEPLRKKKKPLCRPVSCRADRVGGGGPTA